VVLVMRRLALLVALGGLGCGSRPQAVTPQSPNQTLAQFMDAVKAHDLKGMGALWGNERGPVADRMKPADLNKVLTVIQIYLAHEGYRVIDGPLPKVGQDNALTYHLELERKGCHIATPIELLRGKSGTWFVYDVHLETLPNPARGCQYPGAGTPP